MKHNLIIGLELEGIWNEDYLHAEIGSYHNKNQFLEHWGAEYDGSLHHDYEFDDNLPVEIVSDAFKEEELHNRIEELKEYFGYENLNDVVVFNKSCGCHIHFSTDKRFKPNIPFIFYEKTREYFFALLDGSDLRQELIQSIKKHYFRNYAKKLQKGNIERYQEFNFESEYDNQGLEWRSFNLLGVKSWQELEKVLKIGLETIHFLVGFLDKFELFDEEIIEKPKIKKVEKFEIELIAKKKNEYIDVEFKKRKKTFSTLKYENKKLNMEDMFTEKHNYN